MMRHWFAHPEYLWLLLLVPFAAVLGWLRRRARQRSLLMLGRGFAFQQMITRREGIGVRLRLACLFWGLCFVTIATAGPQWDYDWNQSTAPGRDLIVVLDLSRSMLAESPSRLERAQQSLIDLSQEIQKRGGHRLGLVVFAAKARVVCPLTHDYDHFREVVKRYDKNHLDPKLWPRANAISGTRIGQGIQLAVESLEERFTEAQDILLLSDGDDPQDDEEWRLGVLAAKLRDLPVHVVGIGDTERAHPIPGDEGNIQFQGRDIQTQFQSEPLEQIAERTGGMFIPAHRSVVPLGEVFLQRLLYGPRRQESLDRLPVYKQQFLWFLAPAFALLCASMLIQGRARGRR